MPGIVPSWGSDWTRGLGSGSLCAMPQERTDGPGFARLYLLVAACAVAVMLVLWWFASHFNIRLAKP